MIMLKQRLILEEVLTAANRLCHSAIKKTFQEWERKLRQICKTHPFQSLQYDWTVEF